MSETTEDVKPQPALLCEDCGAMAEPGIYDVAIHDCGAGGTGRWDYYSIPGLRGQLA